MLSPLDILQRAREATGFGDVPGHTGQRSAPRRAGDAERPRARRVPFAILIGTLVVGGLALLLLLNTVSAANELRRHELVQKDNAVAAKLQDLRVRIAASAAPENLARAAAELGMVPAGNPAFVVIGPDGKARIMGKPKAVTSPPVPVAPKPTPTPTPSPTVSPSGRPAASTGASRTASTPAAPAGSTRPTSNRPAPTRSAVRPPKPTPTPTPVVTLPGGNR